MTNDTEHTQDTQIQKMAIDQAYKDNALAQVKALVKGNKFDPENVTLETFEGEILQFQAENMLTILRKDAHKKVGGRIQGPTPVDNEIALKEAMTRAYNSLAVDHDFERRIRDVILKRDDKGFGVDGDIIPLPFWKKEFVIYEPCLTCHKNGNIKCQNCSGQGTELCPRCSGSGMNPCSHCRGAQWVQAQNGQKIQCPVCHGQGRQGCNSCNHNGKIQCKTCRGKGITTCPNCNGAAWISDIHVMEIQARTNFDYPRKRLPDKVVLMIEKYGAKISEHARITISQQNQSIVNIDDEEKARQQQESDQRNDIRIPVLYEVSIPYGHIEYNINGKSYYTFLFGTKAELSHVSPFLDDLIKNGIRKVTDAAEGRGDVVENLKQAAEYKTMRQGIVYASRHGLGKAKKMLQKSNPLGLSESAITTIITNADLAMKNITKKPRIIGTIAAGFLHAGIIGGYMLLPVRSTLVSKLPQATLEPIADGLVLCLSVYLGMLVIQGFAQNAVQKVMAAVMPKNANVTISPKLGNTSMWNAGIALAVFIGVLETAHRFTFTAPNWYMNLFG